MAIITPVTDSVGAELPDIPGTAATSVETGTRRSPSGAVLAALAAALITGLLGLAAAGFSALNSNINTLHNNINALRTDVDADISALDAKIDTLRSDMNARFAQVDARFVQIDNRFAQIDERFTQIDERFARMDARFARMDERFDALSLTLLDHTDRLARIEAIHSTHPHTHAQQPDAQQQE